MFTVKTVVNHNTSDPQEEFLYSAKHVMRTPNGVHLHGVGGDRDAEVIIDGPNTLVFVMNENGSTVARYDL